MTDQEKIRIQAKKIMDEFMHALDKVETTSEFGEQRESNLRKKSEHKKDDAFRERMFRNAQKKNDDYIIAEKKRW